MTGSEHYAAAEELLADVTGDDGSVSFGDGGEAYVAAAQVHATLALAAGTMHAGDAVCADPLLTVPEAADQLRIHASTAWAMVKSGELQSLLIGATSRRIERAALSAYIESRRGGKS